MINNIKLKFKNKSVNDVLKLSFGILGGRIIAFASMPLLTRLYSPEDFTLLSVFLAIITTISVVTCLRFEIAIPIVEKADDAASLTIISVLSIIFVSLILSVLVITSSTQIANLIDLPDIAGYLWVIPIGVILYSSYNLLSSWSIRFKRFGLIARTKITQVIFGTVLMIAGGYLELIPVALLIGMSLTSSGGSILLLRQLLKQDRHLFKSFKKEKLLNTFKLNSSYPKYSTLEAFANNAGYQLPILIVAANAGNDAGYLFIAMQVMTIPMALVGKSMSQVYLSRAPEEMRNNRLNTFTFSLMKKLAIIVIPSIIILSLVAPIVVSIIFGEEWYRTGEIIQLLAPWIALQFIVSPVSMVLHIIGEQSLAMRLQFYGVLIRLGGLGLFTLFTNEYTVEVFAFLSAVFYLIYLLVIIKKLKER